MQDLQMLLTAAGLDLDGWTLQQATGISADARTFVGQGINPSGHVESWIAVIPKPGPVVLIGLGLAGLTGMRRKL